MKSLYNILESILDDDDKIKSKAEQNSQRVCIKKALYEFLSCLSIEGDKCSGSTFPLIVNNRLPKHNPGWKCALKYYMRYVLQAHIDKLGYKWYYDKSYDGMCIECRGIIMDALKDGFEKYLRKKNIKYKKFGGQPLTKHKYNEEDDINITYEIGDYDIWFKLWRRDERNIQRLYNKDLKYKEDFLNYEWNFEIVVPQDIWDVY